MIKNKLKQPEIIFTDNFSDRVNYLCYLAQTVVQRNYQSNSFFVLPYLASNIHQTVYFPDLPYPQKFWQNIKRIPDTSAGLPFPHYLTTLLRPFVPKTDVGQNLTLLAVFWQKNQKGFWQKLFGRKLLQKEIGKINKITVLVTEFGPGTSFNFVPHGKKINIFLTMRIDRKPLELLRSFIYALILVKIGKPASSKEKWQRIRTLVDFVCEELGLPKTKPVVLPTRKIMLDSRKYLEKLSFGNKKGLAIKNNQIYLGERRISLRLSVNENLILKELIQLGENILTPDRFSELLWQEKAVDKFSLWGQTKLIQRLRDKLAKEGASPFLIRTIYGKGYSL